MLTAGSAPAAPLSCDPETVVFFPENGPGEGIAYTVEIADEPDEQARGLMFRTEMALDHGMIFIFPQPRPARFWMKNTVLPLDMIFVGDDGRVVNIAERTTPFSQNTWSSEGPVRAVIELNAGQSAEHGYEPGTAVAHPAFGAATGGHACVSD